MRDARGELPNQPQNGSEAAVMFIANEIIGQTVRRSTGGPASLSQGQLPLWQIDQLAELAEMVSDVTIQVEDIFIAGNIPGDLGRIGGTFDPILFNAATAHHVNLQLFPDDTYAHFERTERGELIVLGIKPDARTGQPKTVQLWPRIEDMDTQPVPSVDIDTLTLEAATHGNPFPSLMEAIRRAVRQRRKP